MSKLSELRRQMESWKWHRYYWVLCGYFGRECYHTGRWELLASVVVGWFIVVLGGNWKDFKTALLATGLTLAAFAAWHILRAPFLLHSSIQAVKEETKPSSLSSAFGIFVIVAIFIGGYKLSVSKWTRERIISLEDKFAMEQILQDEKGKGRVEIMARDQDDEAYRLADQLTLVFYQSEWFIGNPVPPTVLTNGPAPLGQLTVTYRDQDDKQHEFVERALKAGHLDYNVRYDPRDTTPNVEVSIYVGKFD